VLKKLKKIDKKNFVLNNNRQKCSTVIAATPRDGQCVVSCMVRFVDQMTKCETLDGEDEFKCVTGAMGDLFKCVPPCVSAVAESVLEAVVEKCIKTSIFDQITIFRFLAKLLFLTKNFVHQNFEHDILFDVKFSTQIADAPRDGQCVVGCMVGFVNSMTKCEGLPAEEEFKCVTGAFREIFRCVPPCVSSMIKTTPRHNY